MDYDPRVKILEDGGRRILTKHLQLHATRDGDVGAGDVGGSVRGEEYGYASAVLGSAEAPGGDALHDRIGKFFVA